MCLPLPKELEHLRGRNNLLSPLFVRSILASITNIHIIQTDLNKQTNKRKLLLVPSTKKSRDRSVSGVAGPNIQMLVPRTCLSQLYFCFCWPPCQATDSVTFSQFQPPLEGELHLVNSSTRVPDCFSFRPMHNTVARSLEYT